jgi:release factor glutamine methyltransferase
MTLRESLQAGVARLAAGPHPDRARLDAEALLLHVARLNRAALFARWKDEVNAEYAAQYAALISRRLAGEPIQYITGEAEFYGLPFRVTRDVLIPRPETEHLVEKALEIASAFSGTGAPGLAETWEGNILDVGTGSGAIAVTLAHHLPHAHLTAIDVSPQALAIAEENAKRNRAAIRFLRGDLLQPVADERFDIVVSNPPYVSTADRDSLAVEVRDYEPARALFAGDDGLDVYRRLIPAAFAVLVPGGFLALEIGSGQAPAVQALLAAAGFQQIETTPDLQGIPRVLASLRP